MFKKITKKKKKARRPRELLLPKDNVQNEERKKKKEITENSCFMQTCEKRTAEQYREDIPELSELLQEIQIRSNTRKSIVGLAE
jgi:hypothetical protein